MVNTRLPLAATPRPGRASAVIAAALAAGLSAVAGTAAVAVAVAGCNSDPAGGTKDGAAVFGMLCASCHGPEGHPPAAMVARLNVRDLTAPDFRARVTPALVEQQVRHGSANKLMPGFEGAITDDQIRAVAAFVASSRFASPR
jgi:mono/diheme cytochrome c family protein